jgi:hypothetical protein
MSNTITVDLINDKKLDVDLSQFKDELTITLPLDVNDDMTIGFIEIMVNGYIDLFYYSYIGYWARGLHYDDDHHCWLCLDHGDEIALTDEQEDIIIDDYKKNLYSGSCLYEADPESGSINVVDVEDMPHDEIINLLQENNTERKIHVFVIDMSFAMRACAHIAQRKGMSEFYNWDANTVDLGVQYTLFGELIYG